MPDQAAPPVQDSLQPKTFSRGDFVYAKSGTRPHWPARVLSIVSEQKCQVFLYGLHLPVGALTRNIVPVTEETRKIYGKERRNDSSLKDAFSSALSEMDLSPELADPLLEVLEAEDQRVPMSGALPGSPLRPARRRGRRQQQWRAKRSLQEESGSSSEEGQKM